jgi:hypothetical protein
MSAEPTPFETAEDDDDQESQSETDMDIAPQRRDMLNDLIRKQVVRSLGSPDDLLKVQVQPIGGDRYRVNVFVGKDYTSGRISDSFFLTTDEEGTILTSSPEIIRMYELKT